MHSDRPSDDQKLYHSAFGFDSEYSDRMDEISIIEALKGFDPKLFLSNLSKTNINKIYNCTESRIQDTSQSDRFYSCTHSFYALHAAVKLGDMDLVKNLILLGAKINAITTNEYFKTVTYVGSWGNRTADESQDSRETSKTEKTALDIAIETQNKAMEDYLKSQDAKRFSEGVAVVEEKETIKSADPNVEAKPVLEEKSVSEEQPAKRRKPDVEGSFEEKIVKKMGKRDNREISLYGFPEPKKARLKEMDWQKRVVDRFFKVGKPLKEGKQSHKIYLAVQKYLSTAVGARTPLNIHGCCRRSLIIALSKILTEHEGMPDFVFQLGGTIIKFIPSESTQRQVGNFKMEIQDCADIKYGEGCMKRIRYLLQTRWDDGIDQQIRKKTLWRLLSERLQIVTPFVYTNLNKYGNVFIPSDSEIGNPYDPRVKSNIHFLNGLLFLVTIVEVLVRLYRSEKGNIFRYRLPDAKESDSFPVAIAQARSLHLLMSGQITFTDFFGESQLTHYDCKKHRACYGAVTGQQTIDNIEIMLKKLGMINRKYDEFISELPFWKEFRTEYLAQHKEGCMVPGRSRMYFDLSDIYGHGDESDAEELGYSSADDEVAVTAAESSAPAPAPGK